VITRDTVVVKVPPRITAAKFQQVLEAANSPALSEASAIYDAIIENGVDPAFALADIQARITVRNRPQKHGSASQH
jgi:hypothetical protein